MKNTFIFFCLVLASGQLRAQGTASAVEDIKSQCADVPIEQRVRISVARFVISSSGTSSYNLDNFSTLLEDALVNIECFRVLGMAKDNGSDVYGTEDEETSMAEKPQYMIAGDITKYWVEEREAGFGFSKRTQTAHITFVLKIKKGKDILWTQKFDAKGSSNSKSTNIWGSVWNRLPGSRTVSGSGNFHSSSTEPIEKAYTDAMDAGLSLAVSYIVSLRDKMIARGDRITNRGVNQRSTTIVLSRVTYARVAEVERKLKASPAVIKVTTNFKSGIATFSVAHKGSYDAIMAILTGPLSNILEVTGSEPGINRISAEMR